MKAEIISRFEGFPAQTIGYLASLRDHNNKSWFETNKENYHSFLLTPMQQLASELSGFMKQIDPLFETAPFVGKTISRIYRDTRFSKDKSPYRTSMWITYKRPSKEWTSHPAFFFELTPESYRYGMGFFSATPHTMELFRNRIDTHPKEFEKAISFYPKQQAFQLEGENYKKILDSTKTDAILEWYQKKNLYLVHHSKLEEILFQPALVQQLKNEFDMITEFYHYLSKIQ